MQTSYYSEDELQSLGFKSVHNSSKISRFSRFYGIERISIGKFVRIDDFCIVSGNVTMNNFTHIGAFSGLFANEGSILMCDFSSLSSRVTVYAHSGDFKGTSFNGPHLGKKYGFTIQSDIVINKHSVIGTGSTILPGVTIGEGVSVGAMSLVNKSLPEWGIYAGIPAKFLYSKRRDIIPEIERQFLIDYSEKLK